MDKVNRYLKPIMNKKSKFDIKSWWQLHKEIRRINKLSPQYSDLIEIYEFVELCQSVYMYNNNPACHLFTTNKQNAFIYKEDAFELKFIMGTTEPSITIATSTFLQNTKSVNTDKFLDGEYQFKDIYDEERMLFIISSLMNGVKELMLFMYKNKKF